MKAIKNFLKRWLKGWRFYGFLTFLQLDNSFLLGKCHDVSAWQWWIAGAAFGAMSIITLVEYFDEHD